MDNAILIRRNMIDAGYMEMLDINLIAGRGFTGNRGADAQRQVIINRTSAEKFEVAPEEIVGQNIHFDWQGEHYQYRVIGVMEDYNQTSLRDPIIPIIFEVPDSANRYNYMVASVNPSGFSETITKLEETWKSQVSDAPFEYTFLDETIQKQYHDDARVSKIITWFAVIALVVCSLGVYGLSSYLAERRLKEIGVRKVMGASVMQIMGMMSKEFVKLVLIAIAIATPVAWYGMNKWLQSFEYKTNLDFMLFLFAGLGALLIAMLTISYESLKAANTNPARTLRNE
jgi:putative ABC transport system permease protein